MISTTYSGTPVFLLSYPPDWSPGVEATFEKLTTRTVGSTNREEREPMRATSIATLRYAALLDKTQSTAWRAAESIWDNRPVLVPFWPAAVKIGDASSVIGGLKVWFEPNFTSYELGTGGAPSGFTPTANARVAPVLWGKFVQFPKLQPLNGPTRGYHRTEFSLIEGGSATFALGPNTSLLVTTVINSQTVPTLSVPFSWGENTTEADVRMERDMVGFGRESADTFYPQAVRQRHTLNFKALSTADVRHLFTLFDNRKGSVLPWQCPTPRDTTVKELVRFENDTLKLVWRKPDVGGGISEAQITVVSLPTEAVVVSGETPGTTIGGLGGRWWGYKITDGVTTWRLTSYESAITGPGGTFTPAKIEHGKITEELNLVISDVQLEIHHWSGNPFLRLQRQPTSAPLTVQIYEGLVSSPMTASIIFTGTATKPDTRGQKWKVTLIGYGKMLSVMGPRMTDSDQCAAVFGDTKCKMNLASVSSTQTLVSVTSGVARFTTGAANVLANHRFANGYAERTIGGATQRYLITDSYDSGGDLRCILASPVTPAPTGSEAGWVLVPGCGGMKADCVAWGNLVNFRGHSERPFANPAFIPQQASAEGGKK